MFREDNSGFIYFPLPDTGIVGKVNGKTLVYLVAFQPLNTKNQLDNVSIKMPGLFLSDDVSSKQCVDYNMSIDGLVEQQKKEDELDKFYFPNISSEDDIRRYTSINLISCICIGWSNLTYEYSESGSFWNASFTHLSDEGKRLYYSMKKLHNSKEIRILTFNHI